MGGDHRRRARRGRVGDRDRRGAGRRCECGQHADHPSIEPHRRPSPVEPHLPTAGARRPGKTTDVTVRSGWHPSRLVHLAQARLRTSADVGANPGRDSESMLSVTFLGHAGLALDADGFKLLADPWFARTGAFLGSWHQFPRNDHLDRPELFDVDWVAVSHEHLDHMDSSVLTRLPARTRVLIPRYPSPEFRNRLIAAGVARVVELT